MSLYRGLSRYAGGGEDIRDDRNFAMICNVSDHIEESSDVPRRYLRSSRLCEDVVANTLADGKEKER